MIDTGAVDKWLNVTENTIVIFRKTREGCVCCVCVGRGGGFLEF